MAFQWAFSLLPFSYFETGCDEKRGESECETTFSLANNMSITTLAMANIKDNPPFVKHSVTKIDKIHLIICLIWP